MIIISTFINAFFTLRAIKFTGKIELDMYKKASGVDLKCYDDPAYYDKLIITSKEFSNKVFSEIDAMSNMFSSIGAMVVLIGVVFTISPFIAVFPLVSFIANFFIDGMVNKKRVNFDIELNKGIRKRDYSRRVFYEPEYAKEIRLTNIKKPLLLSFIKSAEHIFDIIKKNGMKIAVLEVFNGFSTYTFPINFCQNVFLAYFAIVFKIITLGDVVAMTTASNNMRYKLQSINRALNAFRSISLYAENCRILMDYIPDIKTNDNSVYLDNITTPKEIRFENVCFRYNDKQEYVLNNISFTIKPSEKIAFVGHNGAGKTTLIKLILRLYDPSSGNIYYDNINIRDINVEQYRMMFGTVFQDYQIFSTSIAENVYLSEPPKDYKKELGNALNIMELSEKVDSLHNKENTMLTREYDEQGVILSGGQSQRLTIARLLVREFSTAILDEPSSALDPIAEYNLNNTMLELSKNKTIIFISHRLKATMLADTIYHLEKGKIIECGSHRQLIENNKKYAYMFSLQSKKKIKSKI